MKSSEEKKKQNSIENDRADLNQETGRDNALKLAGLALCGLGYYTTKLLKEAIKNNKGKSL